MSSSTGNDEPPPKKKQSKLARLVGRVVNSDEKSEAEKKDEDTSKRFQDFFDRT